MEPILGQLAQFGFGGVVCALMIYLLFKDNSRLKDDAEKDNEWKINTIQRQTEASFTLAASLTALTNTLTTLTNLVNEVNTKVSK